jgi:hypothetical protein
MFTVVIPAAVFVKGAIITAPILEIKEGVEASKLTVTESPSGSVVDGRVYET